jgi:hypothetical protein
VILAHVAGVPVEEVVLPLASGAGTVLLLARAWVAVRFRKGPRC